ncbi:hypothetical protein [Streptomyces benahoarensis]|uniref:Uncharacterized protein n=1 Tax=Streptomyces benahoarensis TaxID=2595054 RepID=A0A553YVM3_9ACTN|nr:hypothetical protein [Streptomyces benahoarensis]TSB20679.1 hypothetical protein FNJ62_20575 [Streptomyces benahoarensis]TSB33262.1 hypothetical protein FNZ23_23975 [Streptomyces benahoarensis]
MTARRLNLHGPDGCVLLAAVEETPVPETVTAVRTAVRLRLPDGGRVTDHHLRVAPPAPRPWPLLADVLVVRDPGRAGAAHLAPGAAVLALPQGPTECRMRCGPRRDAWVELGSGHAAVAPWEVWASLAHAWLVAGLPVRALAAVRAAPGGHPAASSAASRARTASARSVRFTPT